MFQTRAIEPGLPVGLICTQPNGRTRQILYFMSVALSDVYQLKTCLGVFFITLSDVKSMAQNLKFLIWPM